MALNTAVSAPNPMFDVMVGHLCHAIRELFADYGITVERSEDKTALAQSPGISGLAVIGYAGEHVRGALVMSAAEQATRAWLSALGVSDGECADTLGEFSNMLLGRLKARLLDEGFSILLATPTTASGASLRLSMPPPHAQSNALVFEGPGWRVGVRLDASFDPEFRVRETHSEGRAAEAGTELLFF